MVRARSGLEVLSGERTEWTQQLQWLGEAAFGDLPTEM